MEAKAVCRYIGSSPRKMRVVINLIRKKPVDQALEILRYCPRHASKDAIKVLRSAIANLYVKLENQNIEPKQIYVKEVFVNQGPMLKRIMPAPQGRAYRIRKRSNHLTIVVATNEQ